VGRSQYHLAVAGGCEAICDVIDAPPSSDTNLDFDQKLNQLNLQIQTIANGHGWIGTMAELRNALGNP